MDKSLDGVIRSIEKKMDKIDHLGENTRKLVPVSQDIIFEYHDRGDILVFGHDSGVSYGYDNQNIYKTVDEWVTREPIFEAPSGHEIRTADYASVAKILKNGRILIATSAIPRESIYGYLWISNEDRTEFTKVLDMPGGIPTASWGFKDFGSMLFAAEYAVGDFLGRRAYMSTDGGLNWKVIYERPLSEINTSQQCHVHDIGYDPYRNIVWLAFGDGDNRQLIYSHNFGKDWYDLFSGYPPIDPIGILATPEYTLFGNDLGKTGIDVLPHTDLVDSKYLTPEGLTRRWSNSRDEDTISLVTNATVIDGVYYFAETFESYRNIATIVCSPDGWNFYDVINIEVQPGHEFVSGLMGLYDDGVGNLRSAVKVVHEGNRFKELIVKKPQFKTI